MGLAMAKPHSEAAPSSEPNHGSSDRATLVGGIHASAARVRGGTPAGKQGCRVPAAAIRANVALERSHPAGHGAIVSWLSGSDAAAVGAGDSRCQRGNQNARVAKGARSDGDDRHPTGG